jgi:hypothetical protein
MVQPGCFSKARALRLLVLLTSAAVPIGCGSSDDVQGASDTGGRGGDSGQAAEVRHDAGGPGGATNGGAKGSGGNAKEGGAAAGGAVGVGGQPATGGSAQPATGGWTGDASISIKKYGEWIDVTPPGISLDPGNTPPNNNYGAQQVVADPANPGTFLVAFTYQGVWKSIDFGATWARLTPGDQAMDNGRPAMEIAPDGSYILSTLLYPINGFSNGCWKSVAPLKAGDPELGKAWRRIEVPNVPAGDDMGGYQIDPADKTHVIGLPHTGTGHFYESSDSGETWTAVPVSDAGSPARLHLIDRATVLSVYDWGSGVNPRLGTNSGGTWIWQEVVTKDEGGATVAGQTSFHSDQQIFVDRGHRGSGALVVYTGGPEGIHRSADGGATWTKLSTPIHGGQGVVATATTIYSTASFATNNGVFAPGFMVAPRDPGTPGSVWTAPPTPSGLTNGWLRAGVATDGVHYVIVAGMWNAGLWIYVEP